MSRARNGWVLPVSLLLALLLGLLPLPGVLQALRPYWLALVLAYWLLEEPRNGWAWASAFALGLLADLAFGGLLGEQSLRLVVLAFILRALPRAAAVLPGVAAGAGDRRAAAQRPRHQRRPAPVDGAMPQLPWLYWAAPLAGHAAVAAAVPAARFAAAAPAPAER